MVSEAQLCDWELFDVEILLDGKLEGAKNSSGEAVVQPLNDRKMSRIDVQMQC